MRGLEPARVVPQRGDSEYAMGQSAMGKLPPRLGAWPIGDLIASGGCSDVFSSALPDGTPVALKVAHRLPRQHPLGIPDADRLEAEAQILESVSAPHLVRSIGSGEENGFAYLAMPKADGGSLGHRLADGYTLKSELLRATIDALANALAALHSAGVVHRDVKPSNVLFFSTHYDELAVLADLGEAVRIGDEHQRPWTPSGSERFRAPEQESQGAAVDCRCDFYGATATLVSAHFGAMPPAACDVPLLMQQVGGAWRELLAASMSYDPNDRIDLATQWRSLALRVLD